jgi:hypothetical protein
LAFGDFGQNSGHRATKARTVDSAQTSPRLLAGPINAASARPPHLAQSSSWPSQAMHRDPVEGAMYKMVGRH